LIDAYELVGDIRRYGSGAEAGCLNEQLLQEYLEMRSLKQSDRLESILQSRPTTNFFSKKKTSGARARRTAQGFAKKRKMTGAPLDPHPSIHS